MNADKIRDLLFDLWTSTFENTDRGVVGLGVLEEQLKGRDAELEEWYAGLDAEARQLNPSATDVVIASTVKAMISEPGSFRAAEWLRYGFASVDPSGNPTVPSEAVFRQQVGKVAATAAAGSTEDPLYPKMLESFLVQRGMLEKNRGFDDNGNPLPDLLSTEAQAALLDGAKDWFALKGVDTSAWTWETTAPIIDRMGIGEIGAFWEMVFPQDAQQYYTIAVPDQHGDMKRISVPAAALGAIQQQMPLLSRGQLHSAIVTGAQYDNVDYQSILFVADQLGQVDPFADQPDVDPTTGQVLPESMTPSVDSSYEAIAGRLAAGYELYRDKGLAFVHAIDPSLAGAVRATPYNLSTEQVNRVKEMIKDFQRHSTYEGTPATPYSINVMASLEPDSKVELEREEKPGEVREQFRELYRSWFLTDPTSEQLGDFEQHFDRELAVYARELRAATPNPFGPVASGRVDRDVLLQAQRGEVVTDEFAPKQPSAAELGVTYLRDSDMYQPLFLNKPTGVTESDYTSAFRSAATSALGSADAHLATESTKAGMQTGRTSDVARHAMYSGAGAESATFRGRLARAGNVLRRST